MINRSETKFVGVKELAYMLGLSVQCLRELAKQNKIPFIRSRGSKMFIPERVVEALEWKMDKELNKD